MSVDQRALLEKAFLSIEELQRKLSATERAGREPIAVVGLACRFPGRADDPDTFWELVRNGADTIREVPDDRWDASAHVDEASSAAGAQSRRGGFLANVARFDAAFFGIAPREAARMDPQQRLWLEVAWEALESAGQSVASLAGSTSGVFVGICSSDYGRLELADAANVDAYDAAGGAYSIVANRLSYLFDLRGPSMAIDTACSSSLVAVHQACLSLRQRECDLAIAGGVNLILAPENSIALSRSGMLSPDGQCRAFDAAANGTVRGEGCGAIVLKRLSDALANGDPMFCLIRGSAINQDGRSNGLTAPNVLAQEAVLRQALANAGMSAAQVSYIEAHGTGTPLGDPIEVEALTTVYGEARPDGEPCALGSVKPNIGHLEAAAGIAGLVKAALALRHKTIPPLARFERLNPHITLDGRAFVIPTTARTWTTGPAPRAAAVSSFGFGGTNAHVVLEEAPAIAGDGAAPVRRGDVLTVSARTPEALLALAEAYEQRLGRTDAHDVSAFCHWTNVRRSHHPYRIAVAGNDPRELAQKLAERRAAALPAEPDRSAPRKVTFVFSGQGAQWAGMGKALFDADRTFKAVIEDGDARLRPLTGWSLVDVLRADDRRSRLDRTDVAQPALFAMHVALASIWRGWGIQPDAVVGHSVGEIAATHVAGILEWGDALRLVALRGQVMQRTHGLGAMLALEASEDAVAGLLTGWTDRLTIAAINGPQSIVLSGDAAAVAAVRTHAERCGIRARPVSAEYAFHHPQMSSLARELDHLIGRLPTAPATMSIASTLTGRTADGRLFDAAYWARQMCEPVRFQSAVAELLDQGHRTFIEVSPHPVLCGDVRRSLSARNLPGAAIPSLRRGRGERADLLAGIGELYVQGHTIAFDRIYQGRPRPVPLPSYPWQRKRFWFNDVSPESSAGATPGAGARCVPTGDERGHPLLGVAHRSALGPTSYETHLSLDAVRYLADHQIDGASVVPLAAFLEMALAAAPQERNEIGDLAIEQPLVLAAPGSDRAVRRVQLVVSPDRDDAAFQIFSAASGGDADPAWTRHVAGRMRSSSSIADRVSLDRVRGACTEEISVDAYYAGLRDRGLEYGPAFTPILALWTGAGQALGRVCLGEREQSGASAYRLHPALLDGCLQVVGATLADRSGDDLVLPVALDSLTWHGRSTPNAVWCHAWVRPASDAWTTTADVRVIDDDQGLVASIRGLTLKHTSRAAFRRVVRLQSDTVRHGLYELAWRAVATEQSRPPRGCCLLVASGRDDGDSALVARALARLIDRHGGSCTVSAGDVERAPLTGSWQHIVYLDSIDATPPDTAATSDWEREQAHICGNALRLVQLATGQARAHPPRLWLVTRNAQPVESGTSAPGQTALWGLGRVLAREHPDVRPVCVDLDGDDDAAASLFAELSMDDEEDQVAWRRGQRYVARLVRMSPRGVEGPETLAIDRRGVLDNLCLRKTSRRPPGAGEVEIRVEATGLNFRDVLGALDMYPGGPKPLGGECAGIVTAVGAGVSTVAPGDAVVALAPASFATYAVCDETFVVRKPDALAMAAAAALPVASLTAAYALRQLATLEPGERILIHSAAGGVGLAAVQLARRIGAEVFATAGSDAKRAYLEALGVAGVFSSRSSDFGRELRAVTNGEGVDVVLNSLVGELTTESLSLLRPGGRFIELGKRGGTPGAIPAGVSYQTFDLDDVCASQPALIRRLLVDVLGQAATGELAAMPVRAFPLREAAAAFRFMAQARHIGKIVVTQGAAVAPRISDDTTYLITGGLGALGLTVAQWLVEMGARHLVLVGRQAPSPAARERIAAMAQRGAQVVARQVDVQRSEQVAETIAAIAASMPVLRGIVHAAGVLDDGVAAQQTWPRFAAVLAPKVAGAWNLHLATRHLPLDFFVMFSSAATLIGPPGQSSYAAANAFLDGLADYRRQQGLPAVSIGWGPWAEIGMARTGQWSDIGIESLSPAAALMILERAMAGGATRIVALPIDWSIFRDRVPAEASRPIWRDVMAAPSDTQRAVAGRAVPHQLRQQLAGVPPAAWPGLVEAHVSGEAKRILRLTGADGISPHTPLQDLGLDSLMAIELRNALSLALECSLPASLLFDYPTIASVSAYLVSMVAPAAPQAGATDADDQQLARVAASLEQLSETEAESLLRDRLERL